MQKDEKAKIAAKTPKAEFREILESDEFAQTIANRLDAINNELHCSVCNKQSFSVLDALVRLPAQSPTEALEGPNTIWSTGSGQLPVVIVSCMNCGHVMAFNVFVMLGEEAERFEFLKGFKK